MSAFIDVLTREGAIKVTNLRGLRRWRAAYANADQSPAKIWCVGDSMWWGMDANGATTGIASDTGEQNADLYGWAGRLRQRFANEFNCQPAGVLQTFPYIGEGSTGYDTRIVGLGKTTPTSFGLMGGRSINNTSNAGGAGSWTFSLPSCTAFELTYWDGDAVTSEGGTFTYAVDGGGAITVTRSGTNTYKTVRVTGLSQAAHTVGVTASDTRNTQLNHCAYDSEKGVTVGRFGKPGWTIADMIGVGTNGITYASNAGGQARWQQGLTCGSPDLLIIGFGHNDAGNQVTAGQLTTAAYHQSTLQTQVNAIVATGACVLLMSSPWPRAGASPGPDDYDAYWAVRDLIAANTDHCAHVKIADYWGSAAQANADSRYTVQTTNSVHLNKRGNGDIGGLVHRILTRRDIAY